VADWYVSSAVFATRTAWQATHAYVVGDLVKATAPATGKEYVWRCTTAGTSASGEPTWSTAYGNNQTKTDGGVTWTNVTGQSTYGWSAAAGTIFSIGTANSNRPAAGDRVFVSSDHSESFSGVTVTIGFGGVNAYGLIQIVSVNRAGSTPPVETDITNGASITHTSTSINAFTLEAWCPTFWQGISITVAGSSPASINFNLSGSKSHYFKNCTFNHSNSAGTNRIVSTATAKVTFDNCTVQFGAVQTYIGSFSSPMDFTWLNTPSAIPGATLPTSLFQIGSSGTALITCRGVDFSAYTGILVTSNGGNMFKVLFDSCRVNASATRYSNTGVNAPAVDECEYVNCYDGTNVINERYTAAGTLTTDRSTTLSGGAQDDLGAYSLKLVSSSRSDIASMPLDSFWLDVENTLTGSSKTATVEIISAAALNNNDIKLLLEYMGTSGNPIASFGENLTSVLAAASALPSSSNTWANPPGTPQKQLLQVTFTPQRAGRVRGLVRLGKPSATVWVNPQIAIS